MSNLFFNLVKYQLISYFLIYNIDLSQQLKKRIALNYLIHLPT